MKRFQQRNISFIVTALYLLVSLSPLASISSLAKHFFQAAAKECSGDCRLCGCSTIRSASQTCCCWQKRVAAAKKRQQCALNQSLPAVTKTGGDCCSKYFQQYAAEKLADTAALSEHLPDDNSQKVSISICPCGSDKELAFAGGESSQHIPCRFLAGVPAQPVIQVVSRQPEELASYGGEPPDPPPKIHKLS